MRTIITLFLLVTCSLSITAQQYDLKLNLSKGQQYTQVLTMNLDMAETISDQAININTSIKYELKQTVKSLTAEGNFVLENEYKHISISIDAMGQQMSYDTDSKDTSGNDAMKTYADVFKQILGKKFSVTLSPKGKVIEVKGLKELMSSLMKRNNDPTVQKLIEGTLDDAKMSSNFESSYHIFPDVPVKIGEKWSQKNLMESIVPMNISTVYTLKAINNGKATIAASGDFSVNDDNFESGGMKMKLHLAGNCDGFYDLDIKTGISTTSNVSIPMIGTMEISGMQIPVSISSAVISSTTPVN